VRKPHGVTSQKMAFFKTNVALSIKHVRSGRLARKCEVLAVTYEYCGGPAVAVYFADKV
jgi:hypothetical protein